jgi:hypothetical protein
MIIKNQPAEEYHAHPAIGSTTAKLALKSMQLFRDRQTGVYAVEDKAHFQVGRLAHMMLLEPARFAECVTTSGPINERTGAPYGRDTKAYAEWQKANPGLTVVDPWLHTAFLRMPEEVRTVLKGGETEVSAYQEIDGLPVKCRSDHLRGTVITDLKTIKDVDDWPREIRRRAYWFSAAWYRRVMLAETGKPHSFRLIFMEKNAPWRWRIVDLMADYSLYGDAKVERVMSDIRYANKYQDWSDTGDVMQIAELPEFMDESDDEEEEVA